MPIVDGHLHDHCVYFTLYSSHISSVTLVQVILKVWVFFWGKISEKFVIFGENFVLQSHHLVLCRNCNGFIGNGIKMSKVCIGELVLPLGDVVLMEGLWEEGLHQAQREGGVGRAVGQELSVFNVRVRIVIIEIIDAVLDPEESEKNTNNPEQSFQKIWKILSSHFLFPKRWLNKNA